MEFKDSNSNASGRKVTVQLKSGASLLRTRKTDGKEVFDVKDPRHLLNVTRYLKARKDESRRIVFDGEKLDAPAVWRLRGSVPRTMSAAGLPRIRFENYLNIDDLAE